MKNARKIWRKSICHRPLINLERSAKPKTVFKDYGWEYFEEDEKIGVKMFELKRGTTNFERTCYFEFVKNSDKLKTCRNQNACLCESRIETWFCWWFEPVSTCFPPLLAVVSLFKIGSKQKKKDQSRKRKLLSILESYK